MTSMTAIRQEQKPLYTEENENNNNNIVQPLPQVKVHSTINRTSSDSTILFRLRYVVPKGDTYNVSVQQCGEGK